MIDELKNLSGMDDVDRFIEKIIGFFIYNGKNLNKGNCLIEL